MDHNYVRAKGSLLNQQMAEIDTYFMQSLAPYRTAYGRGDKNEAARIARESQQWYVDWIKANQEVPGLISSAEKWLCPNSAALGRGSNSSLALRFAKNFNL